MIETARKNKLAIAGILLITVSAAIFAFNQTDIISSENEHGHPHSGDAMQAQEDLGTEATNDNDSVDTNDTTDDNMTEDGSMEK